MFGENGAVLTEISDVQLEREIANRDHQLHIICVLGFWASVGVLMVYEFLPISLGDDGSPLLVVPLMAVMSVLPGIIGFALKAIHDERIKDFHSLARNQAQLSPLVVALVLTLVISSWRGVGLLMSRVEGGTKINDLGGLIVVGAIVFAFAIMIVGPYLMRLGASRVARIMSRYFTFFRWPFSLLGKILSIVDAWLVHFVAPMVGITSGNALLRYAYPAAHLIPCAIVAWFLGPVLALAAIAWAFIIAIAIARRWAWTESDREKALRNTNYKDEHLKVGITEDLRDEALAALLFLIALLPLAMRQFHILVEYNAFDVPPTALNNPVKWIEFFGVELAKAVPFVDWAEIFNVQSGASISYDKKAFGSLAVFISRAIVDLVFLAALIEAVTVALRWRRHKMSFFEQEITALDGMIESEEFAKLYLGQKDGKPTFRDEIDQFSHYDETGLRRAYSQYRRESPQWYTARALMRSRHIDPGTAEERFRAVGLAKVPKQLPILATYEEAKAAGDVSIETWYKVREHLNGKPPFNELRGKLIRDIISLAPSDERTTALRYTLIDVTADSIIKNRRLTIAPLAIAASSDPRAEAALRKAAVEDERKTIREAAKEVIKNIDAFRNVEQRSKEFL